MKIYLIRHAIAVSHETVASAPTPKVAPSKPVAADKLDRPLIPKGIKRLKQALLGLKECIPPPDLILTSPLIRALDTAKIIADSYGCSKKLMVTDLLSPGSPPKELRSLLAKHRQREHVVLVGHEPDLSEFAALLLDARGSFLELKKSGACCIEFNHTRSYEQGVLLWLMPPRVLRRIKPTKLKNLPNARKKVVTRNVRKRVK
jgi:phosphohistidine phosphatase